MSWEWEWIWLKQNENLMIYQNLFYVILFPCHHQTPRSHCRLCDNNTTSDQLNGPSHQALTLPPAAPPFTNEWIMEASKEGTGNEMYAKTKEEKTSSSSYTNFAFYIMLSDPQPAIDIISARTWVWVRQMDGSAEQRVRWIYNSSTQSNDTPLRCPLLLPSIHSIVHSIFFTINNSWFHIFPFCFCLFFPPFRSPCLPILCST